MAECVSGSGLSIESGRLTLDPSYVAPVMMQDYTIEGGHERFDNTSSPGNFTYSSESFDIQNGSGSDLLVLCELQVKQAGVALSGTNRGQIFITSGMAVGGSPDSYEVWMLGADLDMGTYDYGFLGSNTRPEFTQLDVTESWTTVLVPSEDSVVPDGDDILVRVDVKWRSELWNDSDTGATGFDSHDYADFPEVRVVMVGFPQPEDGS